MLYSPSLQSSISSLTLLFSKWVDQSSVVQLCEYVKKKNQTLNYTVSVSELNCCWMQIHVSDVPWGQANQNCWSLEKRNVYRRANHGEWVAHAQKVQTPWWFSRKSFIGEVLREGCRAYEFFWLVGPEVTEWDFRNLNHQPSVPIRLRSQHVVTILHQLRVGPQLLWKNLEMYCMLLEEELGLCFAVVQLLSRIWLFFSFFFISFIF